MTPLCSFYEDIWGNINGKRDTLPPLFICLHPKHIMVNAIVAAPAGKYTESKLLLGGIK